MTNIKINGDRVNLIINKGREIFTWIDVKDSFMTLIDFLEDWGIKSINITHQYGFEPIFKNNSEIEKVMQDNSGIRNIEVIFLLPKDI